MAKKIIRTGTTADPTGDSLKNAFVKVNDNFTELYNALGLDADTLNIGAFEFAGSTMTTTDSTAIVIDQATTITSNLSVGGDIVPQTANGGDLGSSTLPWRSLYVSNNTIYIGGTAVGLDANGNLTVNGSQVTGGSVSSLVNGAYSVEVESTGAFKVNAQAIVSENQFGIEGNGLVQLQTANGGSYLSVWNEGNTKEINLVLNDGVDDFQTWTFNTDRTLILPNDSRIKSATNIDITIDTPDSSTFNWRFGADGELTLPGGSTRIGTLLGSDAIIANEDTAFGVVAQGTNGTVQLVWIEDLENFGTSNLAAVYVNSGGPGSVRIATGDNGGPGPNYWEFNNSGALTFPQGTTIATADGTDAFIIGGAVDKDIQIYTYSGETARGWTFGTDGSLRIPGDITSNGNINIDINLADSTLRRWQFGEDGDLILPAGGDIKNSTGTSVLGGSVSNLVNGTETFTLSAAGNATFSGETGGTDRGIVWDYGSGAGGVNSRIRQDEDGLTVRAYTENSGNYAAPVRILTNQGDNERVWQFNGAGNLTLPGNITLPNGSVIKDTDYLAVAFGELAGTISQGIQAVAVGAGAGYNGQGNAAVAIGSYAGVNSQGGEAVAIGSGAGNGLQGINAVAIGRSAGYTEQGTNAIAIGTFAGQTNQAANSIILNATGDPLEQTTANTFTVKPVRQGETADAMYYNSSTGEITYADAFSFSVAGDDSTQRTISNNESIKFIGSGGITTASDAEGNITITGSGGGSSIPTVVTTGAVGDDGASHCKVQFTVTSATTVTAVGVTAIGVSDPSKGTVTLSGSPATGSFDLVVVTNTTPGDTYILIPFATNASGTGYGAPGLGAGTTPCLVRGTMITMADMSRVAVENITYSDDILVWNFDLGEFASARPVWIKKTQTAVVSCLLRFSDHSELQIVGESPKAHRIFNKEAGKFTYGSMPETPIGTTTFNDQGEEITLISKEWIVGEVEFYNVMTDYHMNLFANSILTSMRYNNVYPITDMKFVKDSRTLRTADDYPNIEERLYKGFRLAEQTQSVEEIETHIQWLLTLEVERETESV